MAAYGAGKKKSLRLNAINSSMKYLVCESPEIFILGKGGPSQCVPPPPEPLWCLLTETDPILKSGSINWGEIA